jgi:outer membrane receptor protein involved in Fe transport
VIDPPISIGIVGTRPAGTPSVFARLDLNYRTDLFGGLTPIAALTYTGARAVGPPPVAGQPQVTLPGHAVLDIGVRQRFVVAKVPMSLRFMLNNVFDKAAWKVVAADTLMMDDRRRIFATLSADF